MSITKSNQIAAWIFLSVAILANAAGYLWSLFNRVSWYDEVVHAFTIFALTYVLALTAFAFLSASLGHGPLVVLAIAGVGLAIGALWEVAEWAYDQMVRPNVILGKEDTIIDLIMDTIGALAAALLARAVAKS